MEPRPERGDVFLSFLLLGASGDLGRHKTLPALFSLFYHGLMPQRFAIIGCGRTPFDTAEFRDVITESLCCRLFSANDCNKHIETFLERCFYFRVNGYDDIRGFAGIERILVGRIEPRDENTAITRIAYLALPPDLFEVAATTLNRSGLLSRHTSKVVVEKPIGRDLASCEHTLEVLRREVGETNTWRVDHYLGKELVQNLMVLRFANYIFEPLWSYHHISHVEITFKDTARLEGRSGYFDRYGIVRDVIQNHLLQIMALVAMEPPATLSADDIQSEKVKLLRSVKPLESENLILGQYRGYTREWGVAPNSTTPTYAACVLKVSNRRWHGVPFLLRAAKGADIKTTVIKIQFKQVPGQLYDPSMSIKHSGTSAALSNQLILRIQPDEGVFLRVSSKVPGLDSTIDPTRTLRLSYKDTWREELLDLPDAYERVLLDVMKGDNTLFVRPEELLNSWRVFDEVLRKTETEMNAPVNSQTDSHPLLEQYDIGSTGPIAANDLAARHDAFWD